MVASGARLSGYVIADSMAESAIPANLKSITSAASLQITGIPSLNLNVLKQRLGKALQSLDRLRNAVYYCIIDTGAIEHRYRLRAP